MEEMCLLKNIFRVSTSVAFIWISVALTEFCVEFECFSLDLTELLLILRRIRLLYLPALCITVLNRVIESSPRLRPEQINSLCSVDKTSSADSFRFRFRLPNVALVNQA